MNGKEATAAIDAASEGGNWTVDRILDARIQLVAAGLSAIKPSTDATVSVGFIRDAVNRADYALSLMMAERK
jgi:hypothetical protein